MLYRADNAGLSTTTTIGTPGTYAAGSKVALQLQIPDGGQINLVEWGFTQDAASAGATLIELATCDTATTGMTAHSTTTVKALGDPNAADSRLTMGTGATAYANTIGITSTTSLRTIERMYAPQQIVKQFPLGDYPKIGTGSAENFLQFRVNTASTVSIYCWLIWEEII